MFFEYPLKWCSYSAGMAGATWNCSHLSASSAYTIQPFTFMQSHIHKVYVYLAVTCHLHFWQNDQDLLCAIVVTRGWNGYWNKSQHRKSTLEKKILPPLQQGFEPVTFQSRVSQESSTLTTELSLPPTECIKLFCQVLIYYCINYFCLILYDTVSDSDNSCGPKWHLKGPRHFQLCVFSLCLDEIRPRCWMKFPRCGQNSPKSHTSEKECFLSYSWDSQG